MRNRFEIDSSQWPEIWQAAYRHLEQTVVDSQLKVWIQPLEWLKSEQNEQEIHVHMGAPNDFFSDWVRDHYQDLLEQAFGHVTGKTCKIEISVVARPKSEFSPLDAPETALPADPSPAEPLHRGGLSFSGGEHAQEAYSVDPRFVFDTFIVGASNQFAHASAVAVAEKPAHQYNPLFIYASPGLGKTHLLHAIGNYLLSKNPSFRVLYVSAENFANDLIVSIKNNKTPQFRNKYRDSFDILLMDDIQFIAGRKGTEEEFFHTFNALYGSKKQIVVTSDRPPKEIERLEERIRTRFEWGLVSDIQPPEIETRIAILKAKAERDDIYLPDDVAIFLATHIKSNIRELEGMLIRLQAQSSLTGAEISSEMSRQILKTTIPEESSQLTVETIQNVVSKHYGIRVLDLKSTSKTKVFSLPRQIGMYLSRKYTGLGFKEIGQYFGGKDHSTVLHACKKIETGFDADTEIRTAVESIQNQL